MENELPEGMSLRPAESADSGYVSGCIRESILASVPEEQRELSDLWMDAIAAVSEDSIANRRMKDEVFVLWNGDVRAGMLWIGESNDQFTCDPVGYLLGIYVDPSLRRKGIGSALLGIAEDLCRDRGYIAMDLNVGVPNTAAAALYESAGFRTQTRVMQKMLR